LKEKWGIIPSETIEITPTPPKPELSDIKIHFHRTPDPTPEDWEKDFDTKFDLVDDMDWDRPLQEQVKDFIRTKKAEWEKAAILKDIDCDFVKETLAEAKQAGRDEAVEYIKLNSTTLDSYPLINPRLQWRVADDVLEAARKGTKQ